MSCITVSGKYGVYFHIYLVKRCKLQKDTSIIFIGKDENGMN